MVSRWFGNRVKHSQDHLDTTKKNIIFLVEISREENGLHRNDLSVDPKLIGNTFDVS